jgi:hypothetical protein
MWTIQSLAGFYMRWPTIIYGAKVHWTGEIEQSCLFDNRLAADMQADELMKNKPHFPVSVVPVHQVPRWEVNLKGDTND